MPEAENFRTIGQQPLGFWTPFWSVSSVIASAGIYALIYRSAEGMQVLFDGFGAELPMFTKLFLATYHYFPIPILIGLIPSTVLVVKRRTARDKVSGFIPYVAVSFGLSLALLACSVVAAYLPIFALGFAV